MKEQEYFIEGYKWAKNIECLMYLYVIEFCKYRFFHFVCINNYADGNVYWTINIFQISKLLVFLPKA